MLQWYGNVPTVWNANENCPPGATTPEFHPLPSEVDVWAIESVFVQLTVVPGAILRSSGTKALFANVAAPIGIETDDDVPPGDGAGDGVGDGAVAGDDEPQAIVNIRIVEATAKRGENIGPSTFCLISGLVRVFPDDGVEYFKKARGLANTRPTRSWCERGRTIGGRRGSVCDVRSATAMIPL